MDDLWSWDTPVKRKHYLSPNSSSCKMSMTNRIPLYIRMAHPNLSLLFMIIWNHPFNGDGWHSSHDNYHLGHYMILKLLLTWNSDCEFDTLTFLLISNEKHAGTLCLWQYFPFNCVWVRWDFPLYSTPMHRCWWWCSCF